jgi:uncharacterized protein (TIGR02147 family)
MKAPSPDIYSYIDFRKYLDDARKERGLTHCCICNWLGMKNTRGYFNNITSGRKNIGEDLVEKIVRLLDLKEEEADYFRLLVNFGQARNPDEKQFLFRQIALSKNVPQKIITEDLYEYFTEWYYPVIKELLETVDFKGNFKELAGRLDPPLPVKKVRESVALLVRLGMVIKGASGKYKPCDKVVSTGNISHDLLMQQYQDSVFKRARQRVMNDPKKHRTKILTISLSKDGLEKVNLQIDRLGKAVKSIAHDDGGADKRVCEFIVHAHLESR